MTMTEFLNSLSPATLAAIVADGRELKQQRAITMPPEFEQAYATLSAIVGYDEADKLTNQ